MTTERIQPLLDPAYTEGLGSRSTDELRAMKSECAAIETSVSYYRRLAQARIEILDAELARRGSGGSIEDLIAKLPEILAGEGARSAGAQTRLAEPDAPVVELEWSDGRQRLITDTTLANLPALDEAGLASVRTEVADFERDLSDVRHRLHGALDKIEHEIALRQAAGTTG
jgi:RsiG-like